MKETGMNMIAASDWYEADNIPTMILKLALLGLVGFIAWLWLR